MRATPWLKSGCTAAIAAAAWLSAQAGWAQASPFRGLWVGSAALDAVNEVTIPLDANNVPIAPDPEVPTPTFDRADLRLLIHVNGAGQASLLKDAAILNRVYGQSTNDLPVAAGENDLALVTDPRLYAEYPVQPAMRYASAVFDFGDAKATEALDAIVETAAREAVAFTTNATLDVSTQGARVQARNDAIALIEPLLTTIAAQADVAEEFNRFLLEFDSAALTAIIADTSDPVVATLTASAAQVRDQSFYGDTRAVEMVAGVVAAVDAAPVADRYRAAHSTASAYADVQNLYQRFISGSLMGVGVLFGATAWKIFKNAAGVRNRFVVGGKSLAVPNEDIAGQLFLARPDVKTSFMVYDSAPEGRPSPFPSSWTRPFWCSPARPIPPAAIPRS